MKNILNKVIAVYVIIASLAILLKIGDIYAQQIGDYPNQICTTLSEDLIYGSTDQSSGGQVTQLQKFLVNRGYSLGSDTFGVFGYGTQDAVSKFQTNSNLIPTGFIGANTRSVIQNISCVGNPSYSNLPSTIQVSNIPDTVCGVNTGYTWNGRECVSLCDINHPWDPSAKRCSGTGYSNNTYYSPVSKSCSGYGPQYSFNGRYCVTPEKMNYCGTDNQYLWNGSACIEKYTTKYLCTTNGEYYVDQNLCPANIYNSSTTYNAYGYNGSTYSTFGSVYTNPAPVVTPNYTFTPTYNSSNYNTVPAYTAPAQATYYLGNNDYSPNYNVDRVVNTPCQNWYSCQSEKPGVSITQYVYTYTTTSYPSSSYNYGSYPSYSNYNYLGSDNSQYYNDYFN
ncbi:MAG: putative peptidoglycan binding domain, partial [Candidatus Parcubacteria bacterium]